MAITLFELAKDMSLAAVPAAGFGMLFNVPPRILGYCAMGGALGHGTRFILVQSLHLPLDRATFLSATLLSFVGLWAARRVRAHPKAFTVAAVIPMVPGISAYTALIAIVQLGQNGFSDLLLKTAVENGLRTGFSILALAVGLAMPGLLFYRKRPIV